MTFIPRKDLPATCYVSQDGGYFYFCAHPDSAFTWRDPYDSNPCLFVWNSGYDPDISDSTMCQVAREAVVKEFKEIEIRWD